MDKISGYIVANGQGGYDVVEKTSRAANAKPFTIPAWVEDMDKTDNTPKTAPNTNSVKTYNTGSIKLPDYMFTKTETARSDEEILKEVEELAKEHARIALLSGNRFEFQSGSKFEELKHEFVSSVSPDREGILRNSTNEIYARAASEMSGMADLKDKEKNKELIDYFMEALAGKGKSDNDIISSNIATRGNNIVTGGNNIIASRSDGYYTQVDIDRGGGMITSLTYDCYGKLQPDIGMKGDMYDKVWIQNGVMKNAEFYDSNGELIAMYDGTNNRTDQMLTKAEAERDAELTGVYNAAFDAVYGRHRENNGTSIMDRAYNSTYERLANSSVA
jgi:hypothetical protein